MREELSTTISNRSAAYFDLRDYVSALADAETVISIRRNWSKGHFRKAKALLGLGRFREAAEAVRLGLDFEPTSTVRHFNLSSHSSCLPGLCFRNLQISLPTSRKSNRSWKKKD